MIDTLKVAVPVSHRLARLVKVASVARMGIDMKTGEVLYELTSASLQGSWDAAISVRVEETRISGGGLGFILVVEGSIHKALFGHNIYGGPSDVFWSGAKLIEIASKLIQISFPPPDQWFLYRIDWAEVFNYKSSDIKRFFAGLRLCDFPRRQAKSAVYATAAHFPGTYTTFRLYHKGSEFKVHDYKKLLIFWRGYYKHLGFNDFDVRADRKLKALSRLAESRLRVEVQVGRRKLKHDFGDLPKLADVTTVYLIGVWENHVMKLMKSVNDEIEIVNNEDAVWERLNIMFGPRVAKSLHGTWAILSVRGIEAARARLTKPTFYRHISQLKEAGVSWVGTDLTLINHASFEPLILSLDSPRRVIDSFVRRRQDQLSSRDFKIAA